MVKLFGRASKRLRENFELALEAAENDIKAVEYTTKSIREKILSYVTEEEKIFSI